MTTTFSVEFGDDFTDHVREIAEEAVSNMDMSDAINSALGGWTDPSDHYDMSDYARQEDLPDMDDMERKVNALTTQVDAMRQAMVALVTALGKAGIVAEVTHKEEGN